MLMNWKGKHKNELLAHCFSSHIDSKHITKLNVKKKRLNKESGGSKLAGRAELNSKLYSDISNRDKWK
jgi:hypothetical protein